MNHAEGTGGVSPSPNHDARHEFLSTSPLERVCPHKYIVHSIGVSLARRCVNTMPDAGRSIVRRPVHCDCVVMTAVGVNEKEIEARLPSSKAVGRQDFTS